MGPRRYAGAATTTASASMIARSTPGEIILVRAIPGQAR